MTTPPRYKGSTLGLLSRINPTVQGMLLSEQIATLQFGKVPSIPRAPFLGDDFERCHKALSKHILSFLRRSSVSSRSFILLA